jgi:hypothetical protein
MEKHYFLFKPGTAPFRMHALKTVATFAQCSDNAWTTKQHAFTERNHPHETSLDRRFTFNACSKPGGPGCTSAG